MNKPTVLKIRAAYVGLKVKAHQETIELGLPGNSPTSSHLCVTGLQSHIATTSAAHMSHINILSILVEKQPGHMPAGGK